MNNRTVDRCDYNVGEYINNRYRVSQTLGEGSFGKVYRVTDSASKDYALKLLRLWEVPPEIRKPLMERFEMEFKTGQIDCDYLVRSVIRLFLSPAIPKSVNAAIPLLLKRTFSGFRSR